MPTLLVILWVWGGGLRKGRKRSKSRSGEYKETDKKDEKVREKGKKGIYEGLQVLKYGGNR
jgi:hypothetical protein